MSFLAPSSFAGSSRIRAFAVLAITLVAMALLLLVALHPGAAPDRPQPVAAEAGDAATYAKMVARMRQGEDYYGAAHAELLAGGYGTRSVFNWRTPLYPTLLSLMPTAMAAQIGLAALALAAAVVAVILMRRLTGAVEAALAGVALVLSLAEVAAPGTVYFSEIAAGLLILLSVSAYGLDRWAIGLAAAIAALFVRELAAPYVVVAVVLALRARRWRELAAWAVGLVGYALYFLWHCRMVEAQLGPGDPAYPEGWLQFGGLDFVLRTARVDGVLFGLPIWVTALLLPPALLGLAGWRGGGRAGATVLVYLVAFTVVGKPFDNYWGTLYTPLLAFGLASLPATVRDLLAGLRRSPQS